MAGAQVAITVPNFYRLEARRITLDFYNAFLEEPLTVQGDALIVPNKPGLGVKIDVEYLKAQRDRRLKEPHPQPSAARREHASPTSRGEGSGGGRPVAREAP